jgi:hypothetical protein
MQPESADAAGGGTRLRGPVSRGIGRIVSRITKTTETVETIAVGSMPSSFAPNAGYAFGSRDVHSPFFDWNVVAEVINGNRARWIDGGPDDVFATVLAATPEVVDLARSLGRDVYHVALALVASKKGNGDRMAERIARKVLEGADQAKLAAALARVPD